MRSRADRLPTVTSYSIYLRGGELPRVPLRAAIDLTYRCNNRCRHCWLWAADTAEEAGRELSTGEWREAIDQARALGVHEWAISGGEPLLREDFEGIFEHATARATTYTLNTNGTLITPRIARLLRRRGSKLVAVYGATAEVYDRVTRNPGGFEALLQGLAYLREAGAGFMVQLIPMRENWEQWDDMVAFAESWSEDHRIGAPWLYQSACGDAARKAEIEWQRLDPADVVALDAPAPADVPAREPEVAGGGGAREGETLDDRVHSACIDRRRELHVDAYGGVSFCCFVKDPALRFDLRAGVSVASARATEPGARGPDSVPPGAVRLAWDEFIPSLAGKVRGGAEYLEGCGACDLRSDCRWCDVYGYLEHGRHGARVEHLCEVAREARAYKGTWAAAHRRYYDIAGVTVQVESDLPISDDTFDARFSSFRVDGPGADTVRVRHHFGLPAHDGSEGAEEVYRRPPWAIYRRADGAGETRAWVYHGISPIVDDPTLHRIAVFNADHTHGEVYSPSAGEEAWRKGGLGALTMFSSDQILLARLLADRDGCLLHSGGLAVDGRGLVFAGHSEAGKSTTLLLVREALGERAQVLCDDRTIVRHWPRGFAGGRPGFYVHGTWSHGDVPDVSSAGVPLRAILFLEQSRGNELVAITDRKEAWPRLLATLIRPFVTAEWWHRELDVLERIADEVPCYAMRFDRSGAVVPLLEELVR